MNSNSVMSTFESDLKNSSNEAVSCTSNKKKFFDCDKETENSEKIRRTILILDSRTLNRECLSKSLSAQNVEMDVLAFASIDEWKREEDSHPPVDAILFNIGSNSINGLNRSTDFDFLEGLKKLKSEYGSTPVLALSDSDESRQILKVLDCGARGYIPTSLGIDVCVEAIHLVLAGGTFVPASSFLAMRPLIDNGRDAAGLMSDIFTARQSEVAQALSRGKANKIIAYELNMCESTVKVHVRNIMRKLKATNRTEAAYKIRDFVPQMSAHSNGFLKEPVSKVVDISGV